MCALTRVAGATALFIALGAQAQAPFTLRDAFELAWQRSQRDALNAARHTSIEAQRRVTESWFAGPATVSLDVRRDLPNWIEPVSSQSASARGKNEWEPGVAAPIWLPGQRAAEVRVLERARARLDAARELDRLRVAGEVRDAFWMVLAAEAERDVAHRRRLTAESLDTDVDRRVRAGELARADALLARGELAGARAALVDSEARLEQARALYGRLVGEALLPAERNERAGDRALDAHPAVRLGREAIEDARARLDLARQTTRGNPTLSAVGRFDRDVYGGDYRNTLRFGITVPLQTDARATARLAAAAAELTQAEVAQLAEERELATQLLLARSAERAAAEQLDLFRQRRELARDSLTLAERDFRLGERSLMELLRVRATSLDADMAAGRAETTLGLARARLNQSLGVLP